MGLDKGRVPGGSVDFASQASAAEQAFRSGVQPLTGSLIHDVALTLDGTRMRAMLMQLAALHTGSRIPVRHQHRSSTL